MGEIGSGKSTLLKILAGLIDYDGIISVDGIDISTLSIGDYILIKDQDTESQNKVYTIQYLSPSTNTTTLLGYSASSYKEQGL